MTASDDEFALPESFSGQRSKLGAYLASLDECFAREPTTFSSDRAKVIFATGHLRGTALKWAMTHPDTAQGPYDKFVEGLQGRFGNPDPKETAFVQLKKLKQHGSARHYRERFAKYASQCEEKFAKDPSSKNKWFYRGLKDDVKDALTTLDWEWKMSFDKFADEVSDWRYDGDAMATARALAWAMIAGWRRTWWAGVGWGCLWGQVGFTLAQATPPLVGWPVFHPDPPNRPLACPSPMAGCFVLLECATNAKVIKIDEKLRPPHLNEQENRYGEEAKS